MIITLFLSFFKLYFIVYAITSVPIFPLCSPPPSTTHSLRQSHTIVHVHVSCVQLLWLLHFLYCTLHPHGYSVTTSLYILIPSPLHSFPLYLSPCGNHQSPLPIRNSVPVLRVCLVCFLDSIVDRHIFSAILLFIVLILFLSKSLNISYNNGLVMMNSFSFFLSGKLLICPSITNDRFAG